ncbi:hypothetical protein [Coprococcus sp. HCN-4056]|jgi:hypothetical protein|uniref:hypothetical protein n=1 Tax=Coprococcus sp. HCN-4056 TaxID=3134671 RepID=UPI002066DAB0|nr:MAG TPA: hypothetical protein [Caudoviricetes sp.]
MKKFIKDYIELRKAGNEFYKKHWFGCIIYTMLCFVIIFSQPIYSIIKDKISEHKNKNIDTSEEEP